MIYVSATPGDYELEKSDGIIVEQLIRPTGLLDPRIEVRPTKNQIDDLIDEINTRIERSERVLVTTLTKRLAEELAEHLADLGIGIFGIKAELAVVEALGLVAVGEDAADGHGAVAVDLQLRDVDGRLLADHAGEGAGRLALLEVAIAEDDLGVVDLLAGHALRQNDQAGGGDVVVDKCSHVYLLSLV